ncbi:MAG TPA: pitrilysin family protein [Spirochaetota bacterium]|nr:pitrilysin family protein [Spirochaetota bacterium]
MRKYVFSNGITLVVERMPRVETVSFGLWQRVGSSNESPLTNGLTHFLEHMLFKGTSEHSASDIAIRMDSVGAHMNAFTTREKTCFYANVVARHAPMVIGLLKAMYYDSVFPPKEIQREKQVVIQEIHMYDDSPDDYIHDRFVEQLWPDHPLGFSISGKVENIEAITRARLLDFFNKHYRTDRLVISAAGMIDPDTLAREIETWPLRGSGDPALPTQPPEPRFTLAAQKKKLEQVQLLIGMPGVHKRHPWRVAIALVNQLWGGSMSSRLFQKIREEHGICYSIYTFPALMQETGYFGISCATSAEYLDTVLTLIRRENELLLKKGISSEEFLRSKEQLKSSLLIGRESVESRMNYIAMQELVFGRGEPLSAVLKRIDAVTMEDIRDVISYILGSERFAVRTLGRIDAMPILKKHFPAGETHRG